MAVWTKVSLNDANHWLQSRKLGTAKAIASVEEGVEDSIYKLTMDNGTAACLRLFERTEATGALTIAARLAETGLPTCPPIADHNGHIQVPLKGKAAALFPWIEGVSEAMPTLDHIYAIGAFMGRMAQESMKLGESWQRENPRGWDWFVETASTIYTALPHDERNVLESEIDVQWQFWKRPDIAAIPHGAIHGDLFRNNVLFDRDGKLAAVLDWGFSASNQPLIYDLAIVANDWCLQDGSSQLDTTRLDALMRGRASVMPLTETEKTAWPMALRMAALRFYLSRALDYHFPRDPDGKTLDPAHFYKILLCHLQHNKSYWAAVPPQEINSQTNINRRNTMLPTYNLAIIGNGSTAINALDAFINHYEKNPDILSPIHITIFGEEPEESCGKGFAYGKIGSVIGNLTESPADGRADYGKVKGAFTRYASQLLGVVPKDMHFARRQLVGSFHAARYQEVKEKARSMGIEISYKQSRATNLTKDEIGYVVTGQNGLYGQFDRVVLAVGDVLSSRFNQAAKQFTGKVFVTPYHAVEQVLKQHDSDTTIVAFGTRSSFVDLVNGYASKGYKGRIIGVSTTGQTSWQAREDRGVYQLQFMNREEFVKTTSDVLAALYFELSQAKKAGAYVPDSLLQAIYPQRAERLTWDFNLKEEAANADNVTYHDVVQAINWESIYQGLNNDDQKRFNNVLADFALYNRVNRVVPEDYRNFVANFETGKASIMKTSFSPKNITQSVNGKLSVTTEEGRIIEADYIINCAIGPAAAHEQADTHELLKNLVRKKWLLPREGSGFDVASGQAIDILGAQARPYLFTGLGLESYGRQAEAWIANVTQDIIVNAIAAASRPHCHSVPRRVTYG